MRGGGDIMEEESGWESRFCRSRETRILLPVWEQAEVRSRVWKELLGLAEAVPRITGGGGEEAWTASLWEEPVAVKRVAAIGVVVM